MPETTPNADETRLYVDTTPLGETRAYARIGTGIISATPALNPNIKSVQYINRLSAKSTKTAYSKQIGLSGERVVGDPFMDYAIGLSEKVGSDCETTMVAYNTWDTETTGSYPARMYSIMISIVNDGSLVGGDSQAIEGTIYVNSEATEGTFNPTTNTFTAAA